MGAATVTNGVTPANSPLSDELPVIDVSRETVR